MIDHIADDLLATVQSAAASLRHLDPEVVRRRPAPDRWTIQEVLGHLIDSAANNHQRFVRAQFTDELVFPQYEQNQWVTAQRYNDLDWPGLIDLWEHYNRHLSHLIRGVDPRALSVRCVIGDYEPVTLRYLLEDYVTHLKHHLAKIAERTAVAL